MVGIIPKQYTMKTILSFVLILGLLFTTNAQADEIINSADMHVTPLVELQDFQTDSNAIQITDDDKGLRLFYDADSGYLVSVEACGHGFIINGDSGPQGAVTPYQISGGGDFIHTTPWEPIGGLLPLRGTGASGTHLQGNDNPPEGNHYDTRADFRAGAQTAARLVVLGEVDSNWRHRL